MNILTLLTPKDKTFYLNSDSSIRQVLEKFDYHKFTVVPLIDEEGRYLSTISEGDILRYIKNNCNFNLKYAENTKIVDIEIYRAYKALDINCSVKEIIELSLNQNFIPIVDDRGMYIGIIKRKDVISYFYMKYSKTNI